MGNLTYDELISIVVALDNEAASCDNAKDADAARSLKWKVFALAVEVKKNEKGVDSDPARC